MQVEAEAGQRTRKAMTLRIEEVLTGRSTTQLTSGGLYVSAMSLRVVWVKSGTRGDFAKSRHRDARQFRVISVRVHRRIAHANDTY